MTTNIGIIVVDKTSALKSMTIKDYKEEELFKKCGFKKADGFGKQTEWKIKMDGKRYLINVYGKAEGKANMENKYDFPPPIDTTLFFGSCAIVARQWKDNNMSEYTSLSLELWNKMYEKLFGGFEDLNVTAVDDEAEEDELDNIPSNKKTKHGYLKDGFVVDTSESSDEKEGSSDEDDSEEGTVEEENEVIEDLVLEDLGSELSEEAYSDEE
jgi:hypothetical protein